MHVLIIVQNLPVPLDRRVWLECQALTRAGYTVSVICPKGPGDPARQFLDGVTIYKYRPAPQAEGVLGYAWEFAYSWARTAALSVAAWRRRPFEVLQACNPPDTFWALAALWRIRGVKFVYDQHDLNPELFLSRFGTDLSAGQRVQLAGVKFLERMTYRLADRVISTNESYRSIAVNRGRVPRRRTAVVRSGPDTQAMRPIVPDVDVRLGGDALLVYLGIMGPQDDVHVVLEVMDELVHRRGRTGLRAALLGFGDCLQDLKSQAHELGLDDVVAFPGRVGPAEIAQFLSSADIGVCPDRKTPLNDVSTMNKVMEFMAYGLPMVSFDLKESRVSAEDCAIFVPSGDVPGFADAVERLLDDPDLRVSMGTRGRTRVVQELDWRPQARSYVGVFDELTGQVRGEALPDLAPVSATSETASRWVNTEDPQEFGQFLRYRGRERK